jgi:hypothetical protein
LGTVGEGREAWRASGSWGGGGSSLGQLEFEKTNHLNRLVVRQVSNEVTTWTRTEKQETEKERQAGRQAASRQTDKSNKESQTDRQNHASWIGM